MGFTKEKRVGSLEQLACTALEPLLIRTRHCVVYLLFDQLQTTL